MNTIIIPYDHMQVLTYSQRAQCGSAVLECDCIVLDCTRSKAATVFVEAGSYSKLKIDGKSTEVPI